MARMGILQGPRMENQMERRLELEMEASLYFKATIQISSPHLVVSQNQGTPI